MSAREKLLINQEGYAAGTNGNIVKKGTLKRIGEYLSSKGMV